MASEKEVCYSVDRFCAPLGQRANNAVQQKTPGWKITTTE